MKTNQELGYCPCECTCGVDCDHNTCPCVECARHRTREPVRDQLVRMAREAGISPEALSTMTLREFCLRWDEAKNGAN